MNISTSKVLAAAGMCAAVVLAGCGGGNAGDTTGPQTTTLRAFLTDAPSCGYDAVNVTVQKVRVHQSASASESDSGWTDITLSPARKINLLNLNNGAVDQLGQTTLSAGHYKQIRLVLDANTGTGLANSVVLSSGSGAEISLDTPSAVQSGIKVNSDFDVVNGQTTDIVLDFDACKSIVAKGNGKYALKPVIKAVSAALNGIGGFINSAAHTMVSAQQNGVIIGSTVPNASTGEFLLARLTPGTYDVVMTADGRATTVIASVPLTSTTSTVSVSTSSAPITLPSAFTLPGSISGTVTLSPASATEPGYVAAQQTFSSGPKITVKYQAADLDTGNYVLTSLPTVAPQLGVYNSKLPIVFAAQSNTIPGTGQYTVEASATGYGSKTISPVDIFILNAFNVNFSLQ